MARSAPLRIASLLSSATEILYGLGLGQRVVAVSHECDYPAEVQCKPKATRSRIDSLADSGAIDDQVKALAAAGEPLYEVDSALLCDLRPDLIVTQAQCDVCAVRFEDVMALVGREPALAQTQVVALAPNCLAEVLDDIRRVGAAADASDAAANYIAALSGRVEVVGEATSKLSPSQRPRVACIEWIEPLMLAANWTPELLGIAGGQSLLADGGRHSDYATWDDLLRLDPQVLIISPCGFDLDRTVVEAARLANRKGFAEMAAVRAKRAWCVDGNAYLNRSGPRLVDSLEILAHLIHPERFGPPAWAARQPLPWRRWGAAA
jgi:iron complex transport system substrate-binding protein